MTVELLAALAGSILSLALAYVPKLKDWYGVLDADGKARVMGILLIVTSLAIFGLACANLLVLFGLEVACTAASAVSLLQILFAALAANQGTFLIAVRSRK
jgi:hypothetical protein